MYYIIYFNAIDVEWLRIALLSTTMLPSSSWFSLSIIYLFVLLFASNVWHNPSQSVKALSLFSWSSWAGLRADDCSLHTVLTFDSVACLVPKESSLDLYPVCLSLNPVSQSYDAVILRLMMLPFKPRAARISNI
jgi:hypothetical protein